jgi:hypothetical protein
LAKRTIQLIRRFSDNGPPLTFSVPLLIIILPVLLNGTQMKHRFAATRFTERSGIRQKSGLETGDDVTVAARPDRVRSARSVPRRSREGIDRFLANGSMYQQ